MKEMFRIPGFGTMGMNGFSVGKSYCLPFHINPDFLIKNLTHSFPIEMLK